MSRCDWTGVFNGVIVGCKLPRGHDDIDTSSGPYLHDPTCKTCAGMVHDPFPDPGVRCIEHGTPEPPHE
jgi:hypothetical protein